MKKIRILTLASVFALSGLMTGCDLFDSDEDSSAPQITEFETANFTDATDTWTTGMALEFYGTAKDDNSLKTLKLDIINSAGTVVETSTKNVSGTSVDFGDGESVEFTISNPGTWAAGAYTAKLTATDNDGLTATSTITLAKVEGTGSTVTTLKDTSVTLGGTGSTAYASSLDVDAMVTYMSGPAKTNSSLIDLYFNNTEDGKNEIRSPSAASWLDWAKKNSTSFVKVATGSYAAANTSAAIEALYKAAGTPSTTFLIVAANDEIAVKTEGGVYRLIKILSINNSGKANVEFSIKGYK